jgi:hypothetical protein
MRRAKDQIAVLAETNVGLGAETILDIAENSAPNRLIRMLTAQPKWVRIDAPDNAVEQNL